MVPSWMIKLRMPSNRAFQANWWMFLYSMNAKTNGATAGGRTKNRRIKPPSKAKYKSDAFEAIHSAASALRAAGAIDETTMRQFDAACLTVDENPE
jgi:hypothetical protein